jgi:hypothetical protein
MAEGKRLAPVKKKGLVLQNLGDEVIVYDPVSHRAHALNRTAALVFEQLDGKHDIDAVARHVGRALEKPPQRALVTAAVNELAAASLLATPVDALPRRAMLRGLAAGLTPLVISVAVPAAGAAGSCLNELATCVETAECCVGLICQSLGYGYGSECQEIPLPPVT